MSRNQILVTIAAVIALLLADSGGTIALAALVLVSLFVVLLRSRRS